MTEPLGFQEPPTQHSLSEARRDLDVQRHKLEELTQKIEEAEQQLLRIIKESKCAIREMEEERTAVEERVAQTLAYVSPIRRLPPELLREIFLFNFQEYPCCAWILAAVCSMWRRLALSMPDLWSKIRLVTTQETPADTIRLWLERSGQTVPLDIEIYLRSPASSHSIGSHPHRRRSSSGATFIMEEWIPQGWANWPPPPAIAPIAPNIPGGPPPPTAYVHVAHPAAMQLFPLGGVAPTHAMLTANGVLHPITATSPTQYDAMPPLVIPDRGGSQQAKSRASTHWGYIAFFYLTEQMHRWERFVFRFDKSFSSMNALKSISGDAPLLQEFEISCADPNSIPSMCDWQWLPSAKPSSVFDLQSLRSLTLQHVPFKWSTPILQNLRSLCLRSLPAVHTALDRIMYMISLSPGLEHLSLSFQVANPAVLPLSPTTLHHLKTFSIGGHYLLTSLVDSLILPSLETLYLNVDARDPLEETISDLLARSNNPPITILSISYMPDHNIGPGIYYHTSVASWNFLGDMDHLHTLQVGGTPFELVLNALGAPEEDQDRWFCPALTTLALRSCQAHSDGVAKLVQIVEARNPDNAQPMHAGGIVPSRLKRLEVHDSVVLGLDVVTWLKSRVDDVVCTEPPFDNSRSPSYAY